VDELRPWAGRFQADQVSDAQGVRQVGQQPGLPVAGSGLAADYCDNEAVTQAGVELQEAGSGA